MMTFHIKVELGDILDFHYVVAWYCRNSMKTSWESTVLRLLPKTPRLDYIRDWKEPPVLLGRRPVNRDTNFEEGLVRGNRETESRLLSSIGKGGKRRHWNVYDKQGGPYWEEVKRVSLTGEYKVLSWVIGLVGKKGLPKVLNLRQHPTYYRRFLGLRFGTLTTHNGMYRFSDVYTTF